MTLGEMATAVRRTEYLSHHIKVSAYKVILSQTWGCRCSQIDLDRVKTAYRIIARHQGNYEYVSLLQEA